MRNFENLKRLSALQEEAIRINAQYKNENSELTKKKEALIEQNLENFIKELKELSKYGSAGYTGFELSWYNGSYNTKGCV